MMEEAEAEVPQGVETSDAESVTEETSLSLTEEKQKKVLLKYIQEKGLLQTELEQREKTVQEYKAKVYDLSNKNKDLQQEIASLKKEKAAARVAPLATRLNIPRSPALARTGVVRPSTAKKVVRAKTAKKKGKSSSPEKASATNTPEPPEIRDIKEAENAIQTLERYKEVAKKFPELKLSVIMQAEKVFFEADINHDGTIDEEELEKLLDKQGHYMTTKKEVKEIMSEIDKDQTGTIDLMEYLAVMERVQQRKRTNLPPALTKSTVCRIQ